MTSRRFIRYAAIGGVCATAGAAAGIAGSGAATSGNNSPLPRHAFRMFRFAGPGGAGAIGIGPGGAGGMAIGPGGAALAIGPGGPVVHSESVVANASGGFDTVTLDIGTVQSVAGDQLTITEGTKTATYKTVTLTIPSGATIDRDQSTASLSDLKSGDRVSVVQRAGKTNVEAFDPSYQPQPPANLHFYRGTFGSVSGDQLTINVSGGGTQTVTVPSDARIVRNGSPASLGDLKSGDDVTVVTDSQHTIVVAHDSSHTGPSGGFKFRFGGGGPGDPPSPGGASGVVVSPPTGISQ
jgi:hypothetical protein